MLMIVCIKDRSGRHVRSAIPQRGPLVPSCVYTGFLIFTPARRSGAIKSASVLRNDPLKIPLARQPVQSAAVGLNVTHVAQMRSLCVRRNDPTQPTLPFVQRKVPQVHVGDCHLSR